MKQFFKALKFLFFSREGREIVRVKWDQKNCKHEHWNCDKQIRVIECKQCGLRAWIDDYVNLYDGFKGVKI